MTAPQFLLACRARGVELYREGACSLCVLSPPVLLTDRLLAALRAAKPALLPLLEKAPEVDEEPQAGGVKYPPDSQSGLLGPPARFPSSGSAGSYPGEGAPRESVHRWALSEWERLRGAPLGPALVAEALAAYKDPGEGGGAEEPDAVPVWLRACAPPPGWTPAEEAAHRRAWANERRAPIRRREEVQHAPA